MVQPSQPPETMLQGFILHVLQVLKMFHEHNKDPEGLETTSKSISNILKDARIDTDASQASYFIVQSQKLVKYIGELESLRKQVYEPEPQFPNIESLTAELIKQCDLLEERDEYTTGLEAELKELKIQLQQAGGSTNDPIIADFVPKSEHEEALRVKDETINKLRANIEKAENHVQSKDAQIDEPVSFNADLVTATNEPRVPANDGGDEQKIVDVREPLYQVGVAVRKYFFEQTKLNRSTEGMPDELYGDDLTIKAGKRAVLRGNFAADASLFHLKILGSPEDLAHFKYLYGVTPATLNDNRTGHSKLIQSAFSYKGTFARYGLPADETFDAMANHTCGIWVKEFKNKIGPGGFKHYTAACKALDNDPDVLDIFEKMEERLVFLLKK